MTLPLNTEDYNYKYNKTLNEDVKLKSNEYGVWDIDMSNGDYVNVNGVSSLLNACIIAIMTRYGELTDNPTYNTFGCRVHELIKDNQTKMFLFKLENYIYETLSDMRRVKTVNEINITRTEARSYTVKFDITSINDESIQGSVVL